MEEVSVQGMADEAVERSSGSGPGFLLGVLLGAAVGAAAVVLVAPPAGEEIRRRTAEEVTEVEAGPAEPFAPLRTVLRRLRGRLSEAVEEGREAAREAEEAARARLAGLTRD